MIRFNLIGRGYIDLEEGALSFKRESGYHNWGTLVCGRSTEFSVLATDHNSKVLGYCGDLDEYGAEMRSQIAAQMQTGNVVKDGSLQVLSFDGNEYKCAFYYDGYNELQVLNGKKLSDFGIDMEGLVWNKNGVGGAVVYPADAPELATLDAAIIQYNGTYNDNQFASWSYLPSINAKRLAEACLDSVGVQHSLNIKPTTWIVANTLNGGTEAKGTIDKTDNTHYSPIPASLQNYLEWMISDLVYQEHVTPIYSKTRTSCYFLKAKQDITITFLSSLSNDIWVSEVVKRNIFQQDLYKEIGGYKARYNGSEVVMEGTPLAGRSVEIAKGTEFVFLDKNDYVWVNANEGGYYTDASPFSIDLSVVRTGDIHVGEVWQPSYNLPDMTIVDLLRSLALAEGFQLYYENGVLKIDDVDLYKRTNLENVVSVGNVARIVRSWGNDTKTEVVDFDSEEYVNYRMQQTYEVDNGTIAGTKENKILFNEGSSYEVGGVDYIYLNDAEASSGVGKLTAKKPSLARSNAGKMLARVALHRDTSSEGVAVNSTAVTCKVLMSEEDFFDIDDHTYYIYRGRMFVWTSASWSSGICTLELQVY